MTYRSYAKINLFLEVLARREDGYHNIETIFQTIDLFDELTFTKASEGIALTCSDENLPVGEENLICKAAALLRDCCGCAAGAQIHLDKRIPVAAGLAGGSGNAAATLIALNELWELRLEAEEIAALSLALGSDVPYCLRGGTVAATGRGEVLETLAPIRDGWFVVAHPDLAIDTPWVYNHAALVRTQPASGKSRTAPFEKAIACVQSGDAAGAVFNRMEPVVFSEFPEVRELKERLLGAGCRAAGMSGSGPTVFGICEDERSARSIADALSGIETYVSGVVRHGVESVAG